MSSAFFGPFANILVSVTIALSFSRGFDRAWPWVLVLGLLADAISLGRVGSIAIILILEAFLVGGFFRRFVFEHREMGFAFVLFFSCLASFLFAPLEILMRLVLAKDIPFLGEMIFQTIGGGASVGNILTGVAVAAFSYATIIRLNRVIDFYEDRVTVVRS